MAVPSRGCSRWFQAAMTPTPGSFNDLGTHFTDEHGEIVLRPAGRLVQGDGAGAYCSPSRSPSRRSVEGRGEQISDV